jgi:NCS2 family nucleobase:cation symporter-2
VLNHYGKGIVKTASILFGMVIVMSLPLFWMTSLQSVANASLIQLPQPLHFGIQFEASSAIIISVLFVINAIQAIGDFSAVTIGLQP